MIDGESYRLLLPTAGEFWPWKTTFFLQSTIPVSLYKIKKNIQAKSCLWFLYRETYLTWSKGFELQEMLEFWDHKVLVGKFVWDQIRSLVSQIKF